MQKVYSEVAISRSSNNHNIIKIIEVVGYFQLSERATIYRQNLENFIKNIQHFSHSTQITQQPSGGTERSFSPTG